MTTETLKLKVGEISEQIYDSLKNGGTKGKPFFQDLLKTTSTWQYHKDRVEGKYQELKGSEKQIAWAKKIREEKTELYLIGHVSNIWDMVEQKKGGRGFNIPMTETEQMDRMRARDKEFQFLFSSHASVIIDNRF